MIVVGLDAATTEPDRIAAAVRHSPPLVPSNPAKGKRGPGDGLVSFTGSSPCLVCVAGRTHRRQGHTNKLRFLAVAAALTTELSWFYGP